MGAVFANQRILVLAALAAMIAEATLFSAFAPTRVLPAVVVDLLLWTGFVLTLLARERAGWGTLRVRRGAWLNGLCYGVLVAGILARTGGIRPPAIVAILLEVGLAALVITGAVRVPRVIRDALHTELRLMSAVARALARRPVAPSEITFTRDSTYPGLANALGVVLVLEGIPIHFLLYRHPVAQAVSLALHVYGLFWVIGDLRALRESRCSFEHGAVALNLGLRWAVRVPLHVIDTCGEGGPEGGAAPNEVRISAGDTPNVVLTLRKPIVARGLLGARRRAQVLRLYVDEPAVFLEWVGALQARARRH
jgi:hypothetical protein